jgi:hypothetical protein
VALGTVHKWMPKAFRESLAEQGWAKLIVCDRAGLRKHTVDMQSYFRILAWAADSSGVVCERFGEGVWLVPTEDGERGLRRLTEGAPDPLWPTLQHHIAVRTPSNGLGALDVRTLNVLSFPAPAAEHEREGGLGEVGFSTDETLAVVSWITPGATTEGESWPQPYCHTELYLWHLDAGKASPVEVNLDVNGPPEWFRAGSFEWPPDGEFVLLRYSVAHPFGSAIPPSSWATLDLETRRLTTILTENEAIRWVRGPGLSETPRR